MEEVCASGRRCTVSSMRYAKRGQTRAILAGDSRPYEQVGLVVARPAGVAYADCTRRTHILGGRSAAAAAMMVHYIKPGASGHEMGERSAGPWQHEQRVRRQVALALKLYASTAKIKFGAGRVHTVVARADDEIVARVAYGSVEGCAEGGGQRGGREVKCRRVGWSALHVCAGEASVPNRGQRSVTELKEGGDRSAGQGAQGMTFDVTYLSNVTGYLQ